jgi:hypothetical protein
LFDLVDTEPATHSQDSKYKIVQSSSYWIDIIIHCLTK